MKKSFITVSPDSGQNNNVLNIVCDKTTLSMKNSYYKDFILSFLCFVFKK